MTPSELQQKAAKAQAALLSRQQQLQKPEEETQQVQTTSLSEKAAAAREELKVRKDNAKLRESQEAVEEPGFFDTVFGQPYERAVDRTSEMFMRMSGADRERAMAQSMATGQPIKQEQFGTDVSSVLIQTAAIPFSLAFDVAGSAVGFGAEEAYKFILPEDMQEDVKQKMVQLAQTDIGRMGLEAAASGVEAWNDFKERYPDDAATFVAALDVAGGIPSRIGETVSAFAKVKPMKIEKVGMRKEVKPLAGIDKDVYNIAFGGQQKTPEQAARTTGPQGLRGIQQQLASDAELEVVDELKRAGLNGKLTIQENFNLVNDKLNKLDDSLLKMSRRVKEEVDRSVLKQNIYKALQETVASSPRLFKNNKPAERQAQADLAQFFANLDQQGIDSVEALIGARRLLDDQYNKTGVDLTGTQLNTQNAVALAVRKGINETTFQYLPEAQKIYETKSRLLNAWMPLASKAGKEASTSLGRLLTELGLDQHLGGTFASNLVNIPLALGWAAAASPVIILKRQLKRPSVAKGRAKIAYAVRDIKQEILKGLGAIKDPVLRKSLVDKKTAAFVALDMAAKKLQAEYSEDEES